MRTKQKSAAFSLIELVVVVSIIAAIFAMTIPAEKRKRQLAQEIVCSSRLRDLGTTLGMYISDNNGQLPPSWAFDEEIAAGKGDAQLRWFMRIKDYYNIDYYNIESSGENSVYSFEIYKCPIMQDWARKNADGISIAGIYGYNVYFTEPIRSGRNSSFHINRAGWMNPAAIVQPSELPLVGDNDTRDPLNMGRDGSSGWLMNVSNPHPAAYDKGWMNGNIRTGRHDYFGPAPNHGSNCNFLMADSHVEPRDITKQAQWPWLGETALEQMSGTAFHPQRTP